jgi:hypothetical protein
MFGAAWVGKELEKKQPSGAVTLEKACTAEVNVDPTKSNFTMAMAHERVK